MSEPRLNLSKHAGMLSAQDVRDLKRAGKPVRAELGVLLPHGKTTRLVTVRLDADECLQLAEAAIRAARLIHQEELATADDEPPAPYSRRFRQKDPQEDSP